MPEMPPEPEPIFYCLRADDDGLWLELNPPGGPLAIIKITRRNMPPNSLIDAAIRETWRYLRGLQ